MTSFDKFASLYKEILDTDTDLEELRDGWEDLEGRILGHNSEELVDVINDCREYNNRARALRNAMAEHGDEVTPSELQDLAEFLEFMMAFIINEV